MMYKEIAGFSNYKVSDDGIVLSKGLLVKRGGGHFKMKERILKPSSDKDGYLYVSLFNANGRKVLKVHRLVAFAFIPLVAGKDHVNHKNGVKTDNRVENLEWCNVQENHDHAVQNGLSTDNANKKVEQYDMNGKLLATYGSCLEAAAILKLSSGNISQAARGIWKQYKGFVFKYKID